jgi:hypothetical protein
MEIARSSIGKSKSDGDRDRTRVDTPPVYAGTGRPAFYPSAKTCIPALPGGSPERYAPIETERQLLAWTRDLFGFPATASGLFVTGTSAANFMGVLVARTRALGPAVRSQGLAVLGHRLTAYVSTAAHGCIARAMEMAGLGRDQLRLSATSQFVSHIWRGLAESPAGLP